MNPEAARIVRERELAAHPEGGYYREVFRSPRRVRDGRNRERSALTVIEFLLAGDGVSTWHRLASDETWHFVAGGDLEIALLPFAGAGVSLCLGPGGSALAVMPAGVAFAARVRGGSGYALVTCCVAPGFEFEDFELVSPAELARTYPDRLALIAAFAPRASA